jgi:hypothetical protein
MRRSFATAEIDPGFFPDLTDDDLKDLERIPKGRNRGGFPNQVELWFILGAGLEASRDGEAFF